MHRSIVRVAGIATLATLSTLALAFRPPQREVALFAGGCFWSMQKAFDGAPGWRPPR
jgi:peptide-methionine (S)-S-oxide reductase